MFTGFALKIIPEAVPGEILFNRCAYDIGFFRKTGNSIGQVLQMSDIVNRNVHAIRIVAKQAVRGIGICRYAMRSLP